MRKIHKVYEIFLQDAYNNNTLLGFYENLDDAVDDINSYISEEELYLKKGYLRERVSTFGPTFDVYIRDVLEGYVPDSILDSDDYYDDYSTMVRGFVLTYVDSLDEYVVAHKEVKADDR